MTEPTKETPKKRKRKPVEAPPRDLWSLARDLSGLVQQILAESGGAKVLQSALDVGGYVPASREPIFIPGYVPQPYQYPVITCGTGATENVEPAPDGA